jgi:hypothetical protein
MHKALLVLFPALFFPAIAQTGGTVIVYRPHAKMVGILLRPSLYADGAQVTRICNGCFFSIPLPTGKHMITMGRSEVGRDIDLKTGETLYFKMWEKKSAMVTGAQPIVLDPVEKDVAVNEMKKLRQATPDP